MIVIKKIVGLGMKKIIAIWFSVQLAFTVLLTPVWAEDTKGAEETATVLEVSATSSVLIEASTGTVIY